MTKTKPDNVPKSLDAIADVVLAYKPKAKTEKAKKRKRLAAKIAKNAPLLSEDGDENKSTSS